MEQKERQRDHFYNASANRQFIFEDGKIMKFNREILSWHSDVFQRMFFGALQEAQMKFEITDCSFENFQTFLDCLLGFEELTVDKAPVILPLADKYHTVDLRQKCFPFLMMVNKMSEQCCHILNMCDKELTDHMVIIMRNYGLSNTLIDFGKVLSPKAVAKLIDGAILSQKIIQNILEWSTRYMQENEYGHSLRSFLKQNGILQNMSLNCFSKPEDFFAFYRSQLGYDLLTVTEICTHYEKMCVPNLSYYQKLEFVTVKRETSKVERFVFVPFMLNDYSPWSPKNTPKIGISLESLVLDLSESDQHSSPQSKNSIYCHVIVRYVKKKKKKGRNKKNTKKLFVAQSSLGISSLKGFQCPEFAFDWGVNSKNEHIQIESMDVTYKFFFQGTLAKTSPDRLPRLKKKNPGELLYTSKIIFY